MLISCFVLCSYPTRPGHQVLRKFNLTLPPCKTVAIVGESGGGNLFFFFIDSLILNVNNDSKSPKIIVYNTLKVSPLSLPCWSVSMTRPTEWSCWMELIYGHWICPGWEGKLLDSSIRYWSFSFMQLLRVFRCCNSGLSPQEPVLFGSSIMDNIRFGKPEATDAEVIHAAEQANAHRFITAFPEGYNTVVGTCCHVTIQWIKICVPNHC